MNKDGPWVTSLLRGKIRGTVLIFDLDQRDCSLSRIFVYGGDGRDGLANKTDFPLRQKRHVLDCFTVCPWSILSGNDGVNPRQSPSFFSIYAFYDRVRSGAEQNLAVKHIRKDEIVAVDRAAGYFLLGIDAGDGFSNETQFFHGLLELLAFCLSDLFLAHHFSRPLNRLNDLRVTCAAAKIARQRKPNFLLGGLFVFS